MNDDKRICTVVPFDKSSNYSLQDKTALYQHKPSSQESKSWKLGILHSFDLTFHSMLDSNHKITLLSENDDKYLTSMKPAISCVAWHPHKPFLAVSKEASIGIYNHTLGKWLEPLLSHSAMQRGIHCLLWCAETDVILAGTSDGISCWRLYSLNDNDTEQSWMQYLHHPRRRPVHKIDVSPHGRVFASMTCGENVIYIWDGSLATYAPLYCVDGYGCNLKWSPSGSCLLVSDQQGGLNVVDTYTWHHDSCCTIQAAAQHLCWLGEKNFIFSPKDSKLIYAAEILYSERMEVDVSSVQVVPVPVSIDTKAFDQGENLVIADMVSEGRNGRYVAISFLSTSSASSITEGNGNTSSSISHVLPIVAVYMINIKPMLTLTLLRVVAPISSNPGATPFLISDPLYRNISPLSFTFGYSQPSSNQAISHENAMNRSHSDEDWVVVDDSMNEFVVVAEIQRPVLLISLAVSWSNGSLTLDTLTSSSI